MLLLRNTKIRICLLVTIYCVFFRIGATAETGTAADTTITASDSSAVVDSLLQTDENYNNEAPSSAAQRQNSQAVSQAVLLSDSDTTGPLRNGAYWGIGFDISLGASGLFNTWSKYLPKTFTAYLSLDTLVSYAFERKDTPSSYTLTIPVVFSYCFSADSQARWPIEASFLFNRKINIASVRINSSGDGTRPEPFSNSFTLSQKLWFYSFSIGASYLLRIPENFFKIFNSDLSFLATGFSFCPVAFTGRKETVVFLSSNPDTTTVRIGRAILESFKNTNAWGLGAGWKIGIVSIRGFSTTAAWESGLYYEGNWFGYFSYKGEKKLWSDIAYSKVAADSPLSFFTNRLTLEFKLLKARSREKVNIIGAGSSSNTSEER